MTESNAVVDAAGVNLEALGGKYLTFKLGKVEYGLQILKVQEIIKMMDITKVPRTPDFVRGVINLRGRVIPVIDLRLKFGMDAVGTTENTCVIVVQIVREGTRVTMGVVVDEVCEVLDIEGHTIEPAPDLGAELSTEFILGIGKIARRVVILVNTDRVLSMREVSDVAGSVKKE